MTHVSRKRDGRSYQLQGVKTYKQRNEEMLNELWPTERSYKTQTVFYGEKTHDSWPTILTGEEVKCASWDKN